MLVTVTTAKDSLENIQRFVSANLAGGVDHMIVFLDAPDAAVETWLTAHEHVTLVVCDKRWWNGLRPADLNLRQRVNSNLARVVLSTVDWVDWLFHIDADEVVWIDPALLEDVPDDMAGVRLFPNEVVSVEDPDGVPTLFKRLLDQPELDLLFSLGVLPEATNKLYFRSHIVGKVGLRPRLDRALKIHNVVDLGNKIVPHYKHPGLQVLHYESYSGAEFVRKWQAMIGSGPRIHFGPSRMPIANGLKSLLSLDLDQETTARYLRQIYRRHMEDPVDVLGELHLLREIDPLQGTHRPATIDAERRAALLEAFERVRGEDKAALSLPDRSTLGQTRSAVERIYGAASLAPRRAPSATDLRRGLSSRIGARRDR